MAALLLAFLLLSTPAAVSHSHLQHHGHGPHHHHHHRSPSMMTATARLDTAPSMRQNRVESESGETRQSLRVLNPFFTTVASAQAPSAEDAMAAMGAAADTGETTTRLDLPSPPPSPLLAAGDPMSRSLAPLQPQAEEASESEVAPAPPVVDAASPPPPLVADEPFRDATSPPPPSIVVDEAYHDATTLPSPPPPVVDEAYRDATIPSPPPPVVDEAYREDVVASAPPPPVHDDAARVVSSGTGDNLGLQQIAKVLASLGYNEMASSATLLADSTPVVTWPGAITVFGAPDVFLQHSCPDCSRRHLLLDHMALGYYPYAELAAAPAMKLPSASAGFCLDVAAQPQRGPFSVHHASLYVNGVMVSEPELYDDGRYVVHGLHGFIPPLSHASCVEDDAHAHHHHQVHLHHYRRRHHLSARSAATSAATDASVVRIMIREAISRLRDSGFGFVAVAMRVMFSELEKLSNFTVFALDDQVIVTGGGHGYVSAVRFHIVPGHRLTRADLLLLRPGTVLPTLAGEDQKLVITLDAGSVTDEVRVNYIAIKEPDVVINSRVAVHAISLPFPRLHLHTGQGFHVTSRLSAGYGAGPAGRHGGYRSAAAAAAAVAAACLALVLGLVAVNRSRAERRRRRNHHVQVHIQKRRADSGVDRPDATNCCATCGAENPEWIASECQVRYCNGCVAKGYLTHFRKRKRCRELIPVHEPDSPVKERVRCELVPLRAPAMDCVDGLHFFVENEEETEETITKKYLRLDHLLLVQDPKILTVTYLKADMSYLSHARFSPTKQI